MKYLINLSFKLILKLPLSTEHVFKRCLNLIDASEVPIKLFAYLRIVI